MLNDWGIYHLHIGTNSRPDGWINRTGSLLFALFYDEDAYFITIGKHGDWGDIELLKIIDANWPELISSYKFFCDDVPNALDDSRDILKLRKAHMNCICRVNSSFYATPGGGVASDGTSQIVIFKVMHLKKSLAQIENDIVNNVNNIIGNNLDKATIKMIGKTDRKLIFQEEFTKKNFFCNFSL